jgi:hypothetical protein
MCLIAGTTRTTAHRRRYGTVATERVRDTEVEDMNHSTPRPVVTDNRTAPVRELTRCDDVFDAGISQLRHAMRDTYRRVDGGQFHRFPNTTETVNLRKTGT